MAPPGYRYGQVAGHGKLLVRDEPLASIIQEALEGFASGRFQSQGEVKRYLESEPAFAERFPSGYVRYEEVIRILTRPHCAGYLEVPKWGISLRKAQHEGLVSLETFTRVQERIKEGARIAARSDIREDFPLRGLVICCECGGPLTSCWSKSKTGKKPPYYMCFQKGCESYRKSIRRDRIEGEFTELLRNLTPSRSNLKLAGKVFADIWDSRVLREKEQAAIYKRRISEIDTKIEGILNRLIDAENKTVIGAYERQIAKLEQDKLVLEEKAASTGVPQHAFEQMFELAMIFLSSPWKLWESGCFTLQRLVLKLTFSDRVPYCRNSGFRTPKLSFPFKVLGGENMHDCIMAETKSAEVWSDRVQKRLPLTI